MTIFHLGPTYTCTCALCWNRQRWLQALQLEGAQRVHISAKYTIMLWCTRLHVYISTSLLRSRRLPMIMTSSITTAVAWLACREKFIWNGVDIFVHFFTTPISILNLTMSPESQERVVSNDILSERKYSQLFTHESNIFLLKQLSGK